MKIRDKVTGKVFEIQDKDAAKYGVTVPQQQKSYSERLVSNIGPDVLNNIKALLPLTKEGQQAAKARQAEVRQDIFKPENLLPPWFLAKQLVNHAGDVTGGIVNIAKDTGNRLLHLPSSLEKEPVSTVLALAPLLSELKATGAGKVLKGHETAVQTGINKPKVGGAPGGRVTRAKEATLEAKQLGINKGSVLNREKIIDKKYWGIQDQIDKLIPTVGPKYQAKTAKTTALDRMANDGAVGRYYPLDNKAAPAYQRAAEKLWQPVLKKAKDGYLSADDIDQAKRDPRLKNAVSKEDKGKVMSVDDQVGADMYRALNSLLEDLSPEIRNLRSQQHKLNKVAENLYGQGAEQVLTTPIGLRANVSRPFQAARSGEANLMGLIGDVIQGGDKIPGTTGMAATNAVVANTSPYQAPQKTTTDSSLLADSGSTTTAQETTTPDGKWRWDPTINKTWDTGERGDWVPNTDQQPTGPAMDNEFFDSLVLMDAVNGGKNLTKIEAMRKSLIKKPTAAQVKQQDQLSQLESALDAVEYTYNRALAEGMTGNFAKGAYNYWTGRIQGGNAATTAEDTRKGLRNVIAKSTGQVGVLTDTDAEQIENILGSIYENPETASDKFMRIREIFLDAQKRRGLDQVDFSNHQSMIDGLVQQ